MKRKGKVKIGDAYLNFDKRKLKSENEAKRTIGDQQAIINNKEAINTFLKSLTKWITKYEYNYMIACTKIGLQCTAGYKKSQKRNVEI